MNEIIKRNHKKRPQKNHNVGFWGDVLWFRPGSIVHFARPCLFPSSVARAINIFDKNVDVPSAEEPFFKLSRKEWFPWQRALPPFFSCIPWVKTPGKLVQPGLGRLLDSSNSVHHKPLFFVVNKCVAGLLRVLP